MQCRFKANLFFAITFLVAAVPLSASLPFALAIQFTAFSLQHHAIPPLILAILYSSTSILFSSTLLFAFSSHFPATPFPCITDLCFASSNLIHSNLCLCFASHLPSLPSRFTSSQINAVSLRCRRDGRRMDPGGTADLFSRHRQRYARSAGQNLQAGFEPATPPLSRSALPFMLSADITPDVSGALWLSP